MKKSSILKACLFATGLSGIVAEYILSTLATYFLGNSVLQWTMILSIMLFSMGLGSRFSKFIEKNLLVKFIFIEFILSLLVSFTALITYTVAAYPDHLDYLIYGLSVLIGLLIGMEIPLVIRLNDSFEELKVNISSAMENDYYGSLLGGVFFAFVGLPYLGLTYTPFVLGAVNFMVAVLLFFTLKPLIIPRLAKLVWGGTAVTLMVITLGLVFAKPIVIFGEQKRYRDKIIYSEQSRYQKIVVTQWKNYHWLYLNGNQQLSSFDEWLYHEPLVHPVMKLSKGPVDVLVLGGGDGCAVREILKYDRVNKVKLVDLDPAVTDLAKTHPVFTKLNKNALNSPKSTVLNTDAYNYLEDTEEFFDVMIIDFPDPKTIELGRLFSLEFFKMCHKHLRPNGVIITQSGSPYYATKAFICIEKTMREAGFNTLPIHNQVLTLGEWGWIIGAKSIPAEQLKPALQSQYFDDIETVWLDHDAMPLITSFGKNLIQIDSADVEINTIHNPVLPAYYRNGNWDLY
ncbi:polyamine aminopropyltransferase [Flammeovirgaceae bacterium SG7u.111]|nr:polyamine aminopropyltransferase [Flammeovirgaceae bacterium SG7u.132]WPO35066.1 polyamine aminopropyltransferase [Flammeovirgaceae bacterium SG7u.111]